MSDVETRFIANSASFVKEFAVLCEAAESIDIAAAWSTPSVGVDLLCRVIQRRVVVRAVIGWDNGGTHPDVYARLHELDPNCIRWPKEGLPGIFHPKVYLFRERGNGLETMLVGSANLTNGGFLSNVEAMLLIRGNSEAIVQARTWFEGVWNNVALPFSEAELQAYADDWHTDESESEEDSDPEAEQHERDAYQAQREADLDAAAEERAALTSMHWSEYLAALERVHSLWDKYEVWVFGDHGWLEAFEQVTPLLRHPIESLRREQRLALFGNNLNQDSYPACAYFGRMVGAGQARSYLEGDTPVARGVQARFTAALALLGNVGDAQPSLKVAEKVYQTLRSINGIGSAVATRYMLLRRPDYFVSVNSASQDGLARSFGIPVNRLTRWEGYSELLSGLWRAPWMKAARPSPGRDERVWLARAALIDTFVYQPESWDHPELDELT